MSTAMANAPRKPIHTNGGRATDHWLTPPWLIKALGPFDLDPCAEDVMPWKTAKKMWSDRGLDTTKDRNWQLHDRVWINPPYSRVQPWTQRFISDAHSGICLVSSKSADTLWYHELLESCEGLLLVKGRLSFCRPDGSDPGGAWLSSSLFARTKRDYNVLRSALDNDKVPLNGKLLRL